MNMKEMEINYKKYLIFKNKEEIKSWKETIQEYKINIAELVLAEAKQEEINKYVKFIKKHEEEIKAIELNIANLIIEIDKLEKHIKEWEEEIKIQKYKEAPQGGQYEK